MIGMDLDEFSEKLQMAFEPPPAGLFRKTMLHNALFASKPTSPDDRIRKNYNLTLIKQVTLPREKKEVSGKLL